jgi:O-acetyl-ADP-ribose deacetylase (regulator of RNase III)
MDVFERIVVQRGDLTEMVVGAIVNAANNDLILGGGVAGAIRRKGGEEIQRECSAIGSVPVGGAAITSAGKRKARFVIHAASMELGGRTSAADLRSSVAHSLRIAEQHGLKTIAFPAVGTGIAGFPMRECAEVMLAEAVRHLRGPVNLPANSSGKFGAVAPHCLKKIFFVLYDQVVLDIFRGALRTMKSAATPSAPG